jgi:hypothetical protein
VILGPDWLAAFPIRPATEAVDALRESWRILAETPRAHFHPGMKEPALTKAIKAYVENVTARERGLLGMWAAEGVIHEIDTETAKLTQERRTDIVYGWNDNTRRIELVFEFKKVGRQKSHRTHYLRKKGLGRFVTGIYSRRQAVAAMVGILIDAEDDVIPPLRDALTDKNLVTELKIRPNAAGSPFERPSLLFSTADFDTEHERDPDLAPSHGTIRVAHFFLSFGYPTSTKKAAKA